MSKDMLRLLYCLGFFLFSFSSLPGNDSLSNFDREIQHHVRAAINALELKDLFSGSVLIAKEDQIIYTDAFGYASKEYQIQNTLDTKFDLGYASSLFTLVAICQLIDQNKLHLSDPINQYISARLLPKVNLSQIQIIHLLTASSGLGDFYEAHPRGGISLWDRSNKALYTTIRSYLQLISHEHLQFSPGHNILPSSTALLLLGAIIEAVTGESFYAYIDKHIFGPSKMHSSGYYLLSTPVNHIATGYAQASGQWENNFFTRADRGSPASGAYTTVHDLWQFFQMLNNHSLITQKLYHMIFTPFMVLKKPYFSQTGIGPSMTYQGLLFTLSYLTSTSMEQSDEPATLQMNGIQTPRSAISCANIASHEKYSSVNIDYLEPGGYLTIVLCNYGDLGSGYSDSPAISVASKIRRLILNSYRTTPLNNYPK